MTLNICKTRTAMAEEFGVDRKTFKSMLDKAGVQLPEGLISPAHQNEIYDKLGKPQSTKQKV